MERQFGLKDFFLFALLILLMVIVVLAMKQYDRQWQQMQAMNEQIKQLVTEQSQTRNEVFKLQEMFDKGVSVSVQQSQNSNSTPKFEDPFARIKAANNKDDYAKGDWFIDVFAANVAKITPMVSSDTYGRAIQSYVLQPLIDRDPDTLQWYPLLARGWEIKDDGLTIIFYLRKNVTFSDGVPMTAQDVVYSWELLNNPQLDSAAERNFYDNVIEYKALDDYTVVFKMREKHYLSFSMAGGRSVLPKHFYSQFTPEQINQLPGLLMGTGPYRMADPKGWVPGKPLEVIRNERYWGPVPSFDKLIWREVNNDVARLTSFKNGEIDMLSCTPEQYVKLLEEPELLKRTNHYAFDTIPAGYNFISWNQKREEKATPFADKAVRQAMTYLTERRRMAKEVLYGYAVPASGPFPKGSPQADPQILPREYDLEKARQLLAQAGWKDRDGDGVLENSKNEPFIFKLTYPSGSQTYDRIVLFVKDSYARAGVVVELDPLEWSVFAERIKARSFDAIMLGWGGGAIEGDIRQMFHSSQIADSADNFQNYSNPKLDQLIDEARITTDEAQRMKLWQQCHDILYEDQPYTFLFNRQSLRFIDKRIANLQMVTTGMNSRDEWYVPQPMQKWGK
jgi:peptide/nickel transport system substrate-binding protein